MPSQPVLKRFYRHECTNCGRPLIRTVLVSSRYPGVSYAGEEVWCRRCATHARQRAVGQQITPDAWAAYSAALTAWANSPDMLDVRVTT